MPRLSVRFQTFERDLGQENPLYDGIVQAGSKMLESIPSGEEKQRLEGKLKELNALWNKVHDDLDQRKGHLANVYSKAKELEDKRKDLGEWLSLNETKLRELLPLSCLPIELAAQKREVNVSMKARTMPRFDFS